LGDNGFVMEKQSVEEIKAKVLETAKKIDNYKTDVYTNTTMEGEGSDLRMNTTERGKVDIKNHKIRMYMETKSRGITISYDLYVIEDTMYIKMKGQWAKMELDETEKENMLRINNPIEREIELLKDAEVELLGEETVGEKDCWVIKTIPNREKLKEYMGSLEGPVGSGRTNKTDYDIEEVSIKYWIAKDTHFIMKVDEKQHGVMNMETEGFFILPVDMETDTIREIYDYNKGANIVLPEGAINAKSIDNITELSEFIG